MGTLFRRRLRPPAKLPAVSHTIPSMRLPLTIFVAAYCLSAAPTPDQIRASATKGLALLQASQKDWYKKQSCTSCHQQFLPNLATIAAREHGIPFDQAIAKDETDRILAPYLNVDRAVQYTHIIDPSLDDGSHLLAARAANLKPNLGTAIYARHLASHQFADGHWTTIDVRPPQSYSNITATSIGLRAIQAYAHPNLAADTKARMEKARAWLAAQSPRDTQERVDQITGLAAAGPDLKNDVKKLANALKARQRPDGGWNSRDGLPSDAYSTGEVLAALNDLGLAATDASYQRGLQFLISTQAADGSWHVVSRLKPPAPVSPPYFETGYPYGHDQFVSSMGASWAVIALARALPKTSAAPPIELAVSAEPWVETMLFGSAADVKELLDKKFDPNSATKSGGTTALMLAMPDLEKAKLLVARGANVNGRSKSRYSALIIAAEYPGSAATVKYLLSQHAEVKLPAGAGQPLFNMTPLMAATMAHNADLIQPLKQAGDDINSKTVIMGMFASKPLDQSVNFGDAATVRALLDAGASADVPDEGGITPLSWAAIGNRVDIARLLIERGADVNHVDQLGMTPLLYAASIDFGDSSLIELLLKSGANPKAKTKEGLTAAQLAKRYGHPQVAKALPAAAGLE